MSGKRNAGEGLPAGALDTFQKKKAQRMFYVVSELLQRGGEANLAEFSGSLAMTHGMDQDTVREYVDDLRAAGAVEVTRVSSIEKIRLTWIPEQAEGWLDGQKKRFRF